LIRAEGRYGGRRNNFNRYVDILGREGVGVADRQNYTDPFLEKKRNEILFKKDTFKAS